MRPLSTPYLIALCLGLLLVLLAAVANADEKVVIPRRVDWVLDANGGHWEEQAEWYAELREIDVDDEGVAWVELTPITLERFLACWDYEGG